MTNYWLPLVALCLTGLGLGDSPIVILSLVFLALSCVTSIFSFLSSFFSFLSHCIFSLPYGFLHKVVFLNIYHYYLSKKDRGGVVIDLNANGYPKGSMNE